MHILMNPTGLFPSAQAIRPLPKRADLPSRNEAEAPAIGYRASSASQSRAAEADLALLRQAFAPARPNDGTLASLRGAAVVVPHAAGRLQLPSPAHPFPAWWLLRRGRMSLGWVGEPGLFIEKHLIGPGEWLDVAGALSSPSAWVDAAQCRTPVELLALPLPALFEGCAQDPELMRAVGSLLAGRVRSLSDTLHDVVTADVPARLARWLLRRCDAQAETEPEPGNTPGNGLPSLVLTELKQSIAAQIGTTSETFSRALRRLSDARIVRVNGYQVTILDTEALRDIAYPAERGGSARQSFAGSRRTSAAQR